MSDMSFATPRAPDGRAALQLVPIGGLSEATQREQEERREREQYLEKVGRSAFGVFIDLPLPPAEALNCDIAGLTPARADLARLYAWEAAIWAKIAEHEGELERVRAKPLVSVKAAKEVLARLETEDREAYSTWLKSGSEGARPIPRAEARAEAMREIASAEWQFDARKYAEQDVESALAKQRGAMVALKRRRPQLIDAVLRETASEIEREIDEIRREEVSAIEREIGALFDRLDAVGRTLSGKHRCLLGLEIATKAQPSLAVAFELPFRPLVKVKAEDCADAATAWREFAAKLEHDPRAES
jgi:hypothetical protein